MRLLFSALQMSQMRGIVEIQMKGLLEAQGEKIDLEFDYATEQLGIIGYDPVFGARPVKRVINKIENALANLILAKIVANSKVLIDLRMMILNFQFLKKKA